VIGRVRQAILIASLVQRSGIRWLPFETLPRPDPKIRSRGSCQTSSPVESEKLSLWCSP
jgi:hypothetical protein